MFYSLFKISLITLVKITNNRKVNNSPFHWKFELKSVACRRKIGMEKVEEEAVANGSKLNFPLVLLTFDSNDIVSQ